MHELRAYWVIIPGETVFFVVTTLAEMMPLMLGEGATLIPAR